MNTIKDRSGESSNPDGHKKEWLNLSLGPSLTSSSKSRPTKSMKGYKCTFCGRKFYSPQALGGHQNGHRKERDAVRRYRDFQIYQSIEVHSNRLVGIQERDRETNVAIMFSNNGDGFGVAYNDELSMDLNWPGSFYLNLLPASPHSDHQKSVDLDLKL